MAEEWINWSGSLRFRPAQVCKPKTAEAIRQVVGQALADGENVRVVGAGHSSVGLVATDHTLISLEKMKGLVGFDADTRQVRVRAGIHIGEAGEEFARLGLAMHNTGDVDYQALAGAFGTGTHGSGRKLPNLAAMMVGCRLVDGRGQVQEFNLQQHPDIIRAARVALGALGIFTELTLQLEPARTFVRKEYCAHVSDCLQHLDELIAGNRMFDFYWYPRSDLVKIRTCNPLGKGMAEVPFASLQEEQQDLLYRILPQERQLKYEEMEYALPFEAGPTCFREVRNRIKDKHRHYVGWRVFYRTIAADEAYLSPFSGRDSVTIALLQNHQLEYKKYFADIEPVFRAYGGRPHWGKKHSLRARELQLLYPQWEQFLKIRQLLDPQGVFLNDYLKEILGL